MADPESDLPPSRSRRSTAAQRQRRHLRRRILGTIGIVVLVVIAALWFSDTIRIPTDRPSFASGAVADKPVVTPGGRRIVRSTEPKRRALNPLQPLKLWVGGDSLAGALGPSLGKMTAATGVVQPYYDSRISTGLIAGNINWPLHAAEQLGQVNPEVVVFMIGTNDAIVYNDSEAEDYAQKVEAMMRILIGDGREVYWVNAPVLADSNDEKRVLAVDRIQHDVAAQFPDNVTYVDSHTLFADDRGQFQSSLIDDSGKRVVMRAGDGVHLTGAGADHLATAIFKLLDARWKIIKQAVPGQTKKVIAAKGSTQVPGSGTGSSSGGSGQSYRSSGPSSGNGYSGTSSTSATSTTTQTTATTQPTASTSASTATSMPTSPGT